MYRANSLFTSLIQRRNLLSAFLTLTALFASTCLAEKPGAELPAGVHCESGVRFLTPDRKQQADLYLPARVEPGELRPAVVIIHGGGWNGGKRDAKREINIGTNLAINGYVGMSIDYALATKSHPTWPQNLYDCKTAVRWLRKNAARLQIDPNRIGVIGGSAGGHLAAMVAYTKPEDALDPEGPHGEFSCQVCCCVDLYGIADLPSYHDVRMLGKAFADAPELYRAASPVTYVRSSSPPTLILHGTKDKTVNLKQSKLLAAALEKAGVEHELVVVPNAVHSFDLEPKQRDLRPVVLGFFDKYLKKTSPE